MFCVSIRDSRGAVILPGAEIFVQLNAPKWINFLKKKPSVLLSSSVVAVDSVSKLVGLF